MKEIRDILVAYDGARAEGKKAALATVVHLEGSSYRRPGARMLITDDGMLTGAISGGCLEGDALQKAMMVLAQQSPRLVTYDTTDEEDNTLGVGLGCNGIIQVLIEPIDASDPVNPIELLRKAVSRRQHAVILTLFSLTDKKHPQQGTVLLIDEEGLHAGKPLDRAMEQTMLEDIITVFRNQKSAFTQYVSGEMNITAFIEFLTPSVTLVVVGAGNDVIPLVEMADVLGWESRVVDGRSGYARPDRFVKACQVLVSKPEHVLEQIPIDAHTYFLLMTHNYNYDIAMLRALLRKKVRYIGVLGPRKKTDRMLDELCAEGMEIDQSGLDSVFGPVGLEIGAETAEEIALSIVAEIKAFMAGKGGQSLRHKNEVIHSREDTLIEERRL